MIKNSLMVIIIFLILLGGGSAQAQSKAFFHDDVLVDATFEDELLFAGVIIHASAANASVIVYDGSTTATVLFRWKEPVDKKSSGEVLPQGGIRAVKSVRLDLTNCTATLLRRDE